MTNRERAMNILHFKPVDRMPAVHFGYWRELLQEWEDQGKISKELRYAFGDTHGDGNEADRELDKILGWDFNWHTCRSAKRGLLPPFETKVLETLPDGMLRTQNSLGLIERTKPGNQSIPSEDDYQLKDREAFETLYKPKMQFTPERIDFEYWKKLQRNPSPGYSRRTFFGKRFG